ncbi:S8 family serine peptidase, partial [Nodularia spumigena]|uniref:S8 family serine peptidase n=1 Tax=Nodularia spumigena TaxID=70799 RepID=UPI002B1EDB8D
MGVLDSGIDFDNDDFSDSEGGTRIQFLREYAYDAELEPITKDWTKAEIDANPSAVTEKDGYGSGGHGTHVAGSATGNGSMNADYMGVAPEADIIFVKGDRSENSDEGFSDDDIIGVAFIFEKAAELGKPAVVNLSLGGNYGPRDGTSLSEQFLTQLTGVGKIVVAAAGNEGFDWLHSGFSSTEEQINYATVNFPHDDVSFDVSVWLDEGTISQYKVIALDLETDAEVASTPWINFGTHNNDTPEGYRLFDATAGVPAGFVYHDSDFAVDEYNGDQQIL